MGFDPCENGEPQTSSSFEAVLPEVSTAGIVFGAGLVVAIAISILPQHVKLFRKRSHIGLSFVALFLQNINCFSAFMNSVLLKEPQFKACVVVGFDACMPNLLSSWQLFVTWLFNFPLYFYYLIFFTKLHTNENRRQRIFSLIFFVLMLFLLTGITGLSILLSYVNGMCGTVTRTFGMALGIISLIITIVQWSPQIYTTWRNKAAGSMSLAMVAMQAPGSAVIVVFMVAVTHENITTWVSYLASAAQLFILLFLLTYYELHDRCGKKGAATNGEATPAVGPLLTGDHSPKSADEEASLHDIPPVDEATLAEARALAAAVLSPGGSDHIADEPPPQSAATATAPPVANAVSTNEPEAVLIEPSTPTSPATRRPNSPAVKPAAVPAVVQQGFSIN
eukprot:TRINITY_DN3434_c0_g1_i7.p1 TRINITY_DN3434_c0_g1~~TRINITY_DN3434_c0_g1_i7.p1  ORF type:complete len:423 (+),score=96.72 TRINITY_DN3434_c0_g1_i7:92-1270(+)